MKFIILTEGGKNIGFGHLSRCVALYQALNNFKAESEIEYFFKGDSEAGAFLQKHDIEAVCYDWISDISKLVIKVNVEDKIIIDSYLAPKSLYDELSNKAGGKILMIDDYNRIEYPAGIVVNPSIYGEHLKYPKRKNVRYLLGKDYIILRKEFWEVPDKQINKKVKNILVTFGGMVESDLIDKIIHSLDSYRFNFISVDASKRKHTAADMLRYMLDADICISGGGKTTYELARVGVPTIGICFAENQKRNLEYGDQAGYLKYAGNSNDKDLLDKIKNKYEELTLNERIKMSEIGRKNIDGRGHTRIIK